MSIDPPRSPATRFQFRLRTLFVATAVASLLASCLSRPVNPLDWLFGLAFSEETFYSPDYTAFGWHRVRPGMTKAEVLKLLGEPLTKGAGPHVEVWEYTSSGPSECYHLRQVHFSRGIVSEKFGLFYID